jgi:predicted TIM-barrel fold metal-dependent hydrolase
MLIDTHTHVVSPDERRYPLRPHVVDTGSADARPAPWYRAVPIPAERLLELMAAAGVDRALLVQAMGAYGDDNRYAVDSASRFPDRFSSVVIVDVAGDLDAAGALRRWVVDGGARGVRLFTITRPEGHWLDQPAGAAVWECAAALDVPVVVTILSHQIPRLRNALERYPDVPVALDHCGFPDLRGGPPFTRATALFELAELANLRLKVSSIVLEQVLSAGVDPAVFVRHLADRFGAARLMWGSDYSQSHFRDYAGLVELGRSAAAALDAEERAAFLGGTALGMWPELGRRP